MGERDGWSPKSQHPSTPLTSRNQLQSVKRWKQMASFSSWPHEAMALMRSSLDGGKGRRGEGGGRWVRSWKRVGAGGRNRMI